MARSPAQNFRDLIVCQKTYQFLIEVYRMTEIFPQKEVYGLTSQFRWAAVSIAANIAEGFRKQGKVKKARLLNIADGSLQKCTYYLILAKDIGYTDIPLLFTTVDEIGKMLNAYS